MKAPEKLDAVRIAPCGINCLACSAFLSRKRPCHGCRSAEANMERKSCANCAKKRCCFAHGFRFCFECPKYPCAQIRELSKRYLKNYQIDLIRNGRDALNDFDGFLHDQLKRCTCPACGGIVDQHSDECTECGLTSVARRGRSAAARL